MTTKSLAPHILACATQCTYPRVKLVGGGESPLYFYYDFIFDFAFSKEAIQAVEKRLCELLSAFQEIKWMEMLASNAKELLLHHQQEIRAECARGAESELVHIMRLGDFYDYVPYPYSECLYTCARIVNWEVITHIDERPVVRISCVGDQMSKNLSAKQKAFKKALKLRHDVIGPKMGLFDITSEGKVYWHSKGAALKEILRIEWLKIMQELNIAVISTPQEGLIENRLNQYQKQFPIHKRIAEMGLTKSDQAEGEGLFSLIEITGAFITLVGKKESVIKDIERLLNQINTFWLKCHLIEKPSIHVDFDTLLSHEGDVYFQAMDLYQREHVLSTLSLNQISSSECVLRARFFTSIEAFIALVIEKNQGQLPFFIEPIQVQIAFLTQKYSTESEKLKKILEQKGIRSQVYPTSLGSKQEALLFSRRHPAGIFALMGEDVSVLDQTQKKFTTFSIPEFVKFVLKDAKKS